MKSMGLCCGCAKEQSIVAGGEQAFLSTQMLMAGGWSMLRACGALPWDGRPMAGANDHEDAMFRAKRRV
jgi:hypothetical protein